MYNLLVSQSRLFACRLSLTVLVFRRFGAFDDNVTAVDVYDRPIRRGVLLEYRAGQRRCREGGPMTGGTDRTGATGTHGKEDV